LLFRVLRWSGLVFNFPCTIETSSFLHKPFAFFPARGNRKQLQMAEATAEGLKPQQVTPSTVAADAQHPKDRSSTILKVPALSKARANAMLAELESGYSAKRFQEKLKLVGNEKSTSKTLAERWELIWQVSTEVFERYGFRLDHAGEHEFNSILKPVLLAYPELFVKVQSIYKVLQLSDDILPRRSDDTCRAVTQLSLSEEPNKMGRVSSEPNEVEGPCSRWKQARETSDASRAVISKEGPGFLRQTSSESSTSASTAVSSSPSGFADTSKSNSISESASEQASVSPEHKLLKQKAVRFPRAKALMLQSDLLTAFTAASFQKHLNELARAHKATQVSRTAAFTAAFRSLVRNEQYRVIPRYGFEPSEKGVTKMLQTFHRFQNDPDIFVNAETIREALYSCINDQRLKNELNDFEGLSCNSRASVVALLQEQVVAFSLPAIQRAIAKLKKQASMRAGLQEDQELPDGGYHLQGRAELAFQVQRHILPRYGFEPSRQGVQSMIQKCSCFLGDQEVSKLFDIINLKLGMSPEACKRFRELVARISPVAWLPPKDISAAISESHRPSCRIGSSTNSCGRFSSSPSSDFRFGLSSRSTMLK
jgi:hypothetical protein